MLQMPGGKHAGTVLLQGDDQKMRPVSFLKSLRSVIEKEALLLIRTMQHVSVYAVTGGLFWCTQILIL